MTAVRKSLPTLRKSYHRTHPTVSRFRVRTRTVFVPYVFLPETEGTLTELNDSEQNASEEKQGVPNEP
ncbi:uncharacterized protein LACBIDRAFT_312507 [Laccaria bicolor S238N-H82]|uniref:Predicted protein n=1 Tax=Laccaria bicolor (strain S238N-H82 / ATCC MYA-4686) TaxID=486041 RepID=B0DWB3_LACBS|nr:uncharacterized protein LACBIDRAFT_312507 [Laccaria bicolor S238N-H82]EDR01195.1 predicted protein [Laccaria bicolor S238N-H82]|eukprot:XP_001888237.1 predicted protein [Laccaria bicolor S238N-H82]